MRFECGEVFQRSPFLEHGALAQAAAIGNASLNSEGSFGGACGIRSDCGRNERKGSVNDLLRVQNLAEFQDRCVRQPRELAKLEAAIRFSNLLAFDSEHAARGKSRAQRFGDAFPDPVHA